MQLWAAEAVPNASKGLQPLGRNRRNNFSFISIRRRSPDKFAPIYSRNISGSTGKVCRSGKNQNDISSDVNFKSDLDAFDILYKEFPGRLILIKYESVAKQPHETFQQLFEFADLPVFSSIMQEITNHTTQNEDGFWSTHRKSSERVDLWKKTLSKRMTNTIQNYCSSVLKRLGYLRV